MSERRLQAVPPAETTMARALREAQERAERSGNGVPMPVFLQPAERPEGEQEDS